MVHIFSVSLLAMLAGLASASSPPTQEVMNQPVHTMESWSWSDCGSPAHVVQLKSISLSPDPPKPGQDLTVTVVGTAQQRIENGAYADVVVKLGLIKLLSKTFDVCDEARNANATIQCPVEEGDYTVVETVALPKEIPQAKFTVAVRGYTADEDDMLCLDLQVNFMKSPFPRFGW
ncbi:ML domain-containing protein [Suillus fuscotomentosus]|uniref:Phosphatidylglycerol/phosphatidylinositol transfer protein n=1 Tax=Suillus fuscotomentosus TaxID=1912939 RepID=A0AAD4E3M9_9AGAM|nr:ML domain-containing protein [Suillus fuscotomentosus]KAG1899139.1 ML domain-containing protein [Suillus fuscotomentosus]